MEETNNKRANRELLLILGLVILASVILGQFDFYDNFNAFLEKHEEFELDEILVGLVFLTMGSLIFSYRRLRDVRSEVAKRKAAQTELARSNENLENAVRLRTVELQHTAEELQQTVVERKQAQEHLSRSEQQYLDMFMNMTEGIGLVDPDEVVLFCNPAYAKIFEVETPEELIGTNLSRFLTPALYEKARAETKERKRGKRSSYEMEIITAKGNRKPILVSAIPKYDENNQFVGTYGAVTDLSELKKIQDLSMRVERLDEAGRVAGQIAHDFNNLLSPLIAYPELIKRKLPADHPVLNYLDTIEYSARQIADINQDLLTLGRRGQYRTQTLNLNKIIERIVEQFAHKYENVEFKAELDPNLQEIEGG